MIDVGQAVLQYEAKFGRLPDAAMNVRRCTDDQLSEFLIAAIESGQPADFETFRNSFLTTGEFEREAIFSEYRRVTGEWLVGPSLDYGHWDIPLDELCGHAKAAIAAGKPINWIDILGPPLEEGRVS